MVEFGTSNKTLCRMSELLRLDKGRPARTSFRFQPAASFILIYLTQVMLNLHSTRDGEAFNLFQNTARVFFLEWRFSSLQLFSPSDQLFWLTNWPA